VSCEVTAEPVDLPLGCALGLAEGSMSSIVFARWRQCAHTWVVTLAPPGEYDWTVRLRRRCGLMSNYFDHLLDLAMLLNIKSHVP